MRRPVGAIFAPQRRWRHERGTQATIDEVLEQEAGLLKDGEKFQDIQEISNYRQALYSAREHLKDFPIRLSFVRELHRVLMNSVRGQDKTPGEFRLDQNWIGKYGCTIEQATFVPPNPLQLPVYLQAWERYLDSDDVDFLLQTAALYARMKLAIQEATHSQYSVHILDAIFSKPIFRASDLAEKMRREFGVHEKTTPGLLRQLRSAGILRELTAGSGRRPAILCFPQLVNVAEGRDVL